MAVELVNDVPFSTHNVEAYREVYALEQWLRRLVFVSLVAKAGTDVLGVLPEELVAELKRRRATLPKRAHLGADTADEYLWMTTLEELLELLVSDGLYPTVKRLSGFERRLLNEKIDEIREIRNIVGHNRAVSKKTLTLLGADVLSLEDGLAMFQRSIFTQRLRICGAEDGTEDVAPYVEVLEHRRIIHDAPLDADAVALSVSRDFCFAGVVPRYLRDTVSDRERDLGEYVDAAVAIGHVEEIRTKLVAITLSLRGGSFEFVWPRRSSTTVHEAVIDSFARALASVWCDEQYADQAERYICHPKLWLHS